MLRSMWLLSLVMAAAHPSPAPPSIASPAQAQTLPQPPRPVAYSVGVSTDGVRPAFRVQIALDADRDGETRLVWSRSWNGDAALDRHARDFEVSGAASVETLPDGTVVIRSAPGAPLRVRYTVRTAPEPEVGAWSQARPAAARDWAYGVGYALFPRPEGRYSDPLLFGWDPLPRGWRGASDLEHARPGRLGQVGDVVRSVVLAGRDLTVVAGSGAAAETRVAMAGPLDFDRQAFARRTLGIIAEERRFWGDAPEPFLVTAAPLRARGRATEYSGAGFADAFALWIGPRIEPDEVSFLIAHEFFHTWNPDRLGAGGGTGQVAVFSEGFTNWYAWRLLLRGGFTSVDRFVASLDAALVGYGRDPRRAAPRSDVARLWEQDPNSLGDLPYNRGALLAALSDAALRRAGSSLDAVMLATRRRARRPEGRDADALTNFLAAAEEEAGVDLRSLWDRHDLRGEPIRLPADLLAPCARIVDRDGLQRAEPAPAASDPACRRRLAGPAAPAS